jgi:CDP-2,3-bis-(O-geranylgeranyl)-sn-glycerol synthase
MHFVLMALWFFLPAGLANGAPVIAKKTPLLKEFKTPLDFGWSFKNRRALGDSKTWRGLLSGTFAGAAIAYIEYVLFDVSFGGGAASGTQALLVGALLGFGALAGDAVESFIKRWRGIESGESWFPFDQIDYILGGLLFSAIFVQLSLSMYLVITVVWFFMHIFWAYVFYLLGFKDRPI